MARDMLDYISLGLEAGQYAELRSIRSSTQTANVQLAQIGHSIESAAEVQQRLAYGQQEALHRFSENLQAQLARGNEATIRSFGVLHQDLQTLGTKLAQTTELVATLIQDRKNTAKNVHLLVWIEDEWVALQPHREALVADPLRSEPHVGKLLDLFGKLDESTFVSMDTARAYQKLARDLLPTANTIRQQAREIQSAIRLGQAKPEFERIASQPTTPFLKARAARQFLEILDHSLLEIAGVQPKPRWSEEERKAAVLQTLSAPTAVSAYQELWENMPTGELRSKLDDYASMDFPKRLENYLGAVRTWALRELSWLLFHGTPSAWNQDTSPVYTAHALPLHQPGLLSLKKKKPLPSRERVEEAIARAVAEGKLQNEAALAEAKKADGARCAEVLQVALRVYREWEFLLPESVKTAAGTLVETGFSADQVQRLRSALWNAVAFKDGSERPSSEALATEWDRLRPIHELATAQPMPTPRPKTWSVSAFQPYRPPVGNRTLFFYADAAVELKATDRICPLFGWEMDSSLLTTEGIAERASVYADGYHFSQHRWFFWLGSEAHHVALMRVGPLLVIETCRKGTSARWERAFYVTDIIECRLEKTYARVLKRPFLEDAKLSEVTTVDEFILGTAQEVFRFQAQSELAVFSSALEIPAWRANESTDFLIQP